MKLYFSLLDIRFCLMATSTSQEGFGSMIEDNVFYPGRHLTKQGFCQYSEAVKENYQNKAELKYP
jgi:hypothetical protein